MRDFPPLTTRQKQVIIGTILGGSSVIKPKQGKNCYLSMRGKDGEWLEHKAMFLSNIASPKPFTIESTNRWHSLCFPEMNYFREKFYRDNKRCLRLEELEMLWDVALAVWYGDCGKTKNDRVIINTHIWGETGTHIILRYFELIDYEPELFLERKNFRVRLSKKSSEEFHQLIKGCLNP